MCIMRVHAYVRIYMTYIYMYIRNIYLLRKYNNIKEDAVECVISVFDK